ncbi:hypothetical protein MNBD_GAMMA11-2815 [hydrothermal vent metagenome]|uniref:Thymidine phosphorylase n=1 Tax=hydrothermal vent metagenome TaxID=652676 RepID=A0A3B0X432_9ZZZZ
MSSDSDTPDNPAVSSPGETTTNEPEPVDANARVEFQVTSIPVKSIADTPVSEESVSEESVSEEPVSEGLVSEELVSEEPASEELVSEELAPEESVSEETEPALIQAEPLPGKKNTDNNEQAVVEREKISRAIKSFIHGESDDAQSTTTKQTSAGRQFHDRRDVIKALTTLQTTHKPRYIPGETQIRTDDFKHALLNSMAKMGNTNLSKSLNAIDGRTIDFVEMLFGAFLRDKNISVALKSLLLELQIPLIKVAMLDSMFFQNNHHPARNTLDTIAHLGIGIEDSENTLFKTMQLIVEQLQNTFEQNLSSFHTALTALSRLTAIEKDKTGQREEVTQKAIFKEHARQIVLNELQRHTYKKIIHKDLKPLILKQWSALMFQRFIKYGKESSQWNEIVTLLKHIIYSVQPITSSEQWVLLSNDSEILISDISAQLNTTRLSPGSIDASLTALREIHVRLIESSEYFQESPDYSLAEKSLDEMMLESEEEMPEEGDPPHIQISRLPRNVKQGVWFEIYNGEDKALRRVKLSVILFDEAKLIFVDRHGNKVIEKMADEFVDELNDKKSRIIADHSIFNHALGQVINSIIR